MLMNLKWMAFVFSLSILLCLPARAIEPTEFDKMPLSPRCQQLTRNYFEVLSIKKQGLERSQAHLLSAQLKLVPTVPAIAINRAYDYPELSDSFLATYVNLSCKADEANFSIQPFEGVVESMRECQKKSRSDECNNELRNKIIGLPKAYKTNESAVTALPPENYITKAPMVTVAPKRTIKLESVGCKIPYPSESRAKSETGVTIVEIVLNADASLKAVRIDGSSGYRQLDNATRSGIKSCQLSELLKQDGVQPDQKIYVTYTWAPY